MAASVVQSQQWERQIKKDILQQIQGNLKMKPLETACANLKFSEYRNVNKRAFRAGTLPNRCLE